MKVIINFENFYPILTFLLRHRHFIEKWESYVKNWRREEFLIENFCSSESIQNWPKRILKSKSRFRNFLFLYLRWWSIIRINCTTVSFKSALVWIGQVKTVKTWYVWSFIFDIGTFSRSCNFCVYKYGKVLPQNNIKSSQIRPCTWWRILR